jgi:hypothetical protein
MQVNVDEKIQFLTNHHLDLLNQRAAMDARMKEAKALGREVAAQHIAAEISVNSAAIIENNAKIKDLQRECYFVNLERKRKLGTAQKLREEIEEAKRRAALQKKIEAKIKKEVRLEPIVFALKLATRWVVSAKLEHRLPSAFDVILTCV